MAEVIGLIGAIPGLIQLGKGSLRLYRDVCNGKGKIAKATRGLDSQLELLISVLERIDARLMLSSTPGSATTPQLKALAPMLPQLKADLKALEDTLSAAAATASGRTTRFFKRTRLIVGGLPKHLEDLTQRLSKSVSLITLELAETSVAMAEDNASAAQQTRRLQVESVLRPCQHDFIPQKLEGTLEWAFSHPSVDSWLGEQSLLRRPTTSSASSESASSAATSSSRTLSTPTWATTTTSEAMFSTEELQKAVPSVVTCSTAPSTTRNPASGLPGMGGIPPNVPNDGLLCIHGGKGCGKSVLAASLAGHLRANKIPCAFFSFFSGSERQGKTASMISTILWQLLDQLSTREADAAYRRVLAADHTSLDALLCELEACIKTLSDERAKKFDDRTDTKKVVIVVDGVDESLDDWRSRSGGVSSQPLSLLLSLLGRHPDLRILLSGRTSSLHGALPVAGHVIELTEALVRDDVSKLIFYLLEEVSVSDTVKSAIGEKLASKACAMFLWVELAFKELRSCYTPAAALTLVEELPPGLDEEYHRLFVRLMLRFHGKYQRTTAPLSPHLNAVRTILVIVAAAAEPLTVEELIHAYATHQLTEDDDTQSSNSQVNDSIEDHLILPSAIIDLCGDFVTITAGHVHFGHASIKEFLLAPPNAWPTEYSDISFFRLDLRECQVLLESLCLKYLWRADLGYPLQDDTRNLLLNRYPLLDYAAKQALACCITAKQSIRRFLASGRFSGWLEYLVLCFIEGDVSTSETGFLAQITVSTAVVDLTPSELRHSILSPILDACTGELERRTIAFGLADPRTQYWASVRGALQFLLQFSNDSVDEDEAPRESKRLADFNDGFPAPEEYPIDPACPFTASSSCLESTTNTNHDTGKITTTVAVGHAPPTSTATPAVQQHNNVRPSPAVSALLMGQISQVAMTRQMHGNRNKKLITAFASSAHLIRAKGVLSVGEVLASVSSKLPLPMVHLFTHYYRFINRFELKYTLDVSPTVMLAFERSRSRGDVWEAYGLLHAAQLKFDMSRADENREDLHLIEDMYLQSAQIVEKLRPHWFHELTFAFIYLFLIETVTHTAYSNADATTDSKVESYVSSLLEHATHPLLSGPILSTIGLVFTVDEVWCLAGNHLFNAGYLDLTLRLFDHFFAGANARRRMTPAALKGTIFWEAGWNYVNALTSMGRFPEAGKVYGQMLRAAEKTKDGRLSELAELNKRAAIAAMDNEDDDAVNWYLEKLSPADDIDRIVKLVSAGDDDVGCSHMYLEAGHLYSGACELCPLWQLKGYALETENMWEESSALRKTALEMLRAAGVTSGCYVFKEELEIACNNLATTACCQCGDIGCDEDDHIRKYGAKVALKAHSVTEAMLKLRTMVQRAVNAATQQDFITTDSELEHGDEQELACCSPKDRGCVGCALMALWILMHFLSRQRRSHREMSLRTCEAEFRSVLMLHKVVALLLSSDAAADIHKHSSRYQLMDDLLELAVWMGWRDLGATHPTVRALAARLDTSFQPTAVVPDRRHQMVTEITSGSMCREESYEEWQNGGQGDDSHDDADDDDDDTGGGCDDDDDDDVCLEERKELVEFEDPRPYVWGYGSR